MFKYTIIIWSTKVSLATKEQIGVLGKVFKCDLHVRNVFRL